MGVFGDYFQMEGPFGEDENGSVWDTVSGEWDLLMYKKGSAQLVSFLQVTAGSLFLLLECRDCKLLLIIR